MYIHLQRRFMQNLTSDLNKYLIIPNKFINYRDINIDFILNNSKELSGMTWKRCGLSAIKGIVKVRVNHLGQIVSVGEY